MNQNFVDLNILIEILPKLPRQYIQYAYEQCLLYNIEDIIDCLLYLEKYYIDSLGRLYKVLKCPIPLCEYHNCPFFHSPSDQRRNLDEIYYKPHPCYYIYKFWLWDYSYKCRWGINCHFAHSSVEMKFHAMNIKLTKISEDDIKTEMRNSMTLYEIALQINEYNDEIRKMVNEIEDKQKELCKVNSEIQELRLLAKCMLCENEVFDFVLNCGHLCCVNCKEKLNGECLRCDQV